ncbi:hypothetical protein [Actinokineospora sp. NPDC004072]
MAVDVDEDSDFAAGLDSEDEDVDDVDDVDDDSEDDVDDALFDPDRLSLR